MIAYFLLMALAQATTSAAPAAPAAPAPPAPAPSAGQAAPAPAAPAPSADAAPPAEPAPPARSVLSCNIAVALFAPGSDLVDASAGQKLDALPASVRTALADEEVNLIVLPHPVRLEPANQARQTQIAEGRGRALKRYLAAHGMPEQRIGIRMAEIDPQIGDNWGEGALLMLEMTPAAWERVKLGDVC